MLYDAKGRVIQEAAPNPPPAGLAVLSSSDDVYTADESRALTPEKVDEILAAANSGDVERQAKLAAEIEEKSWDIAQAVQTRRMAVAGLPWNLEPEDDEDAKATEISEAAEDMLRAVHWDGMDELDSFDQALRYGFQGALLPGFAVVELVWSKGGAELLGYQEVEPRHFTFVGEEGELLRRPRLVTRQDPRGLELPPGKFAVHYHRARPGARCRGGLIRPLAWLHCFQRLNLGDLLTFIERYGMPFVITKVSPESWSTERTKLKALVQAFGPAGGAVLSENVTTELLQASNTTGDVYFKLLEYVDQAVTKIVLGQLATSSEGGGWSKDNAQAAVRQDLLEADCRALESTVRLQVLRPWVLWNYGPDAPVPMFHIQSEPKEDIKATADTAAALFQAGLEWDAEEASERTGMKLSRRPAGAGGDPAATPAIGTPAVAPPSKRDAVALEDRPQDTLATAALDEFLKGRGLRQWFGPLQAAIEAAVSEPDPEAFRAKVLALTDDLPGLYDRMDSREFEALLEGTIYRAAAEGKAEQAEYLAAREKIAGRAKG